MKAFFFLAFLIANHLFSYEVTQDFKLGYHWTGFPLSVRVIEKNLYQKSLTQAAVSEAIVLWEQNYGSQIWSLNEVDNVNTDIDIYWVSNFEEKTGYDEYETLAITIRHSHIPYIKKAEIVLNSQRLSISEMNNLITVLVHELGHTIGLDHSLDQEAIMYARVSLDQYVKLELADDDVRGLEFVMGTSFKAIASMSSRGNKQSVVDRVFSCDAIASTDSDLKYSDVIISYLFGFFILFLIVFVVNNFKKLILKTGKIFYF